MATASYASPDSLVELSALVERTLIDTGRVFRKSCSMPASTHLQRSVPAYYDSFQDALDNLSEQIVSVPLDTREGLRTRVPSIFRSLFISLTITADTAQFIAKAFLERDYEVIKAREAVPQPAEDVTMSDVDQKMATQPQPPAAEQTDRDTEPQKVEIKPDDSAVTDLPEAPEAAPAPQPSEAVPIKEEKEAGTDQALPGATEGVNFDSVLDEGGAANSFDLNLDFGNDDMGNQAFLSGTAFGNNATSGTDKAGPSLPTDNPTAASAGGDTFDMELGRPDDNEPFPDQGNGMEDIMGPGESSFDDLFMENENLDDTGDLSRLEGDSLMNINELDDSWFS
ncbi:uncharacterized protein N7482_005688 [Penicillium canariense]|uniref:Uncharacterized protein n=1 Tax=Penicillium canariense TaxID=189055 RepID=A0A9W9I8I5_9EURO|nr:uncharacterized protein N7482_005688 [Penicillium canariense]KAJ5166907.1 hypothetical protein N7482_005688 [Penicillium canariense]